jgi:hypothetical protein
MKSATCELSHVLTPSINSLLLKCCLWSKPVLLVGKQVAVIWCDIRAVWRVVKQLPAEKLQQCSSASSCMCTHNVMEEHSPDVSIPGLLFWMVLSTYFSVSQHTADVTVISCCMNSTISSPFLFQKTAAISFLADKVCLNLFVCLVDVCESTALWFQHPQTKPRFHHLLLVWCNWEIHYHLRGITLTLQCRIPYLTCAGFKSHAAVLRIGHASFSAKFKFVFGTVVFNVK